MTYNKKGISIALGCGVLWGILPAYWNLLLGIDPLLILCCRIFFAFAFMMGVLMTTGRLRAFRQLLVDKEKMRYIVPAAILISANWGLYIWAVNNGRVLDGSLGYYMSPLIAFALGVVVFKEKWVLLQLVAVAMAFIGVIISLLAFGSFPYVAFGLSLSFAAYGVLKKKSQADPAAGMAVECMMLAPVALVFPIIFMAENIAAVNLTALLLLIGGGALTAIPLFMYARAINDVPFLVVGFLHYISPSLMLVYGLLIGEELSASQLVSFIFIGVGLIIFSIAILRKNKIKQQ